MKNLIYEKKCNALILHKTLEQNGFLLDGVSTENNVTTIHLTDEENKDPSNIVAEHIYVAPSFPEETVLEIEKLKIQFNTAKTTTDKINVLAKLLGLI